MHETLDARTSKDEDAHTSGLAIENPVNRSKAVIHKNVQLAFVLADFLE